MPNNADCTKCDYKYWACDCGACYPQGGHGDPTKPPEKCSNQYCKLQKFRWVEVKRCCRSFNHHIGTTCKHCGQVG